ncbi:MAG TPA: hypothetical protein PLI60_03465 [Anaerolineaceae bacterium]|nr:hypothetical protein [Anaerolineaceae bacterium]
MAKILVNPASLKSSAKQISSVSTLIQKAGETAWRSASGAPSYDGQFGPKVRAIAQAALARAKKQSASTKTLSSSLTKRATAFERADSAAVKGISTFIGNSKSANPGLLKLHSFIGNVNNLLNKVKAILGLGNLGKKTDESKIPSGFISESYEADAKYKAYIDEMNNFMNSPEGREMAAAAALAGLLFVMKDDKGNIIAQWGKAGGTQIPIVFGSMPFETWGGYYSPSTKSITIKDDGMLNKGVLLHEMQHAVDDRLTKEDEDYFKKELTDSEINQEFSEWSKNKTINAQLEELEVSFETTFTESLKTEVNAYDIEAAYLGGLQEFIVGNMLDRSDGNYSTVEFWVILEGLGYEEIYESQINAHLAKFYGNNAYKADVRLDIHGNLQVEIEPVQALVIDDQILC